MSTRDNAHTGTSARLTVRLGSQRLAAIEQAVDDGQYQDRSACIREAVDELLGGEP